VRLGLHVHLPDPPEAVEVVDEGAAHEGLQRLVDGVQVDGLLEHLVTVDLGEDLRHAGNEGRRHRGELRALAGGLEELFRVGGEKLDGSPGAVLQHEGHSAGCADAGNGRRREGERLRLGQHVQPLVDLLHDHRCRTPGLVTLGPRRQGDEVEAVVGRVDAAQQTEADHGVEGLHAVGLLEQSLDLLADDVGALQRRGLR
jgi:hypothetical protein